MKVSMLNGYNRVHPVNPTPYNGYSRVLVAGRPTNGYMLNGVSTEMDLFLRMPKHIQQEYLMDRALGVPVTMNGLKDWLKDRRAAKQTKRDSKSEYKEQKRAIHLAKMQAGTDLGSRLGNVAAQAAESLSNKALSMLPGDDEAIMDAMTETDTFGTEDGNYTEKGLRRTWWEKRSGLEKGGVIVGSVIVLDALTGGHIIGQRLGYIKKKGK